MQKQLIIIIITLLLTGTCISSVWGQSTVNYNAKKLSRSLEENKSDKEIAADYEAVAKEFAGKKDYVKAEDYYKRARQLYAKMNDNEKLAAIDREIAKVQEAQNKINEAISNYSSASKLSSQKDMRVINANDVSRLQASDLQEQSVHIQSNIGLMNSTSQRRERSTAYQQLAQNQIQQGNKDKAISSLENALQEETEAEEAISIKREIANVYASENQMEKAIEINKDLIAEAQKTNDVKIEIDQLQALSSTYLEANQKEEAISLLEQTYDLAITNGRTLDAKNILKQLTEQYVKENEVGKALDTYSDFLENLEPLIRSDSTLIDAKAFQVQEKRISQLENEKTLKDRLIKKQNIFNYVLIASIILILIFLIFIAKALYSIKKKNKRIALQSLRREMNPHFIFNSLNSVNQFIAENNELEANKYLSSYSRLMRNTMENSNKDFISLSTEIEQLKEYLELEHMRFHDKFTYTILISDNLDADSTTIPNMLIQPQLENAIWHGLRYKESGGLLKLEFDVNDNKIIVIIDDNGIGLTQSQALKTKHQRKHRSRGLTNTRERISLLNDLYHTNITMNITEKSNGESGVIVTFSFPLKNKNR